MNKVVSILSESADGRNYWKVLKYRLKEEGSQVVTKCNQLKMQAADGKFYFTDAADTETLFRLSFSHYPGFRRTCV